MPDGWIYYSVRDGEETRPGAMKRFPGEETVKRLVCVDDESLQRAIEQAEAEWSLKVAV